MIKPTVGRIVWFFQDRTHYAEHSAGTRRPQAAIIAEVWSNWCVNLFIVAPDGSPYHTPPTSVKLLQEGDEIPQVGSFCTWMPYQQQQAAAQKAA